MGRVRAVNVFYTRELTIRIKLGATSLEDAEQQIKAFNNEVEDYIAEYLKEQSYDPDAVTNILEASMTWNEVQ